MSRRLGKKEQFMNRLFVKRERTVLTSSNPGTLSLVRGAAAEAGEPPLNWEFTRGRGC